MNIKNKSLLILSKHARIITNDNYVIIANREKGEWVKITKECFNILKVMLDNELYMDQFMNMLADDQDREYFNKIITNLENMNILIDSNIDENQKVQLDSISFVITHRCNLHCYHCSMNASKITNEECLNTKQIKMCIDKICILNPRILTITGGEPMVRDDFIDILKYANEKNLKVSLMTNATLINSDNAEIIAKLIDSINISIDGVDEQSCAMIRGKGVFEKVISAVNILKDVGIKKIALSMTSTKNNERLTENFYELCNSLDIIPMVRVFEEIGRGYENKEYLSKTTGYNINYKEKKYIPDRDKMKICTCGAGIKQITIEHNGDIYPCDVLCDNKYIMGNIFKIENVEDLLVEKKLLHVEAYKNIMKYQPDTALKCKDCKVNLFCLTCIQDIEKMQYDPERLKKHCEGRKEYLHKLIWETK